MWLWKSRPDLARAVVTVGGEIDMGSAPALQTAVEECLTSVERIVVLDLSKVTLLGSAGLSVLMQAREHAKRERIVLRLVTGGHCVDRPLRVCGLEDHFSRFPNLDAALCG